GKRERVEVALPAGHGPRRGAEVHVARDDALERLVGTVERVESVGGPEDEGGQDDEDRERAAGDPAIQAGHPAARLHRRLSRELGGHGAAVYRGGLGYNSATSSGA